MNGAIENVTNGVLDKAYSFGRYRYVVSADKYHALEDTITINNPNEPQVRNVRLKQAWGYLQFANYPDLSDAKLYVDNEELGFITQRPFDVMSGRHDIKIVKPLYETYEAEVSIKDSLATVLTPNLAERFGHLTLRVPDEGASIFIDGEMVDSEGDIDASGLGFKPNRDRHFAIHAKGRSMEPKINDGDICVFEWYKGGSREGDIVLTECPDVDPDTGCCYTIKKYHSEKVGTDGNWEHSKVELKPLNSDYESIVLNDLDGYRTIGVFKGVIKALK